jgi:hypothetical protein
MKKKKKKSKSTGLTRQTRDPCHESLIIKLKTFNIKKLYKKNYLAIRSCHKSVIIKKKKTKKKNLN